MVELSLNYTKLRELAKTTEGNGDDGFTTFMLIARGEYDCCFGDWFEQTWDYGGRSLLGSGTHLALLRDTDNFIAENSPYKNMAGIIRTQLLYDIENAIAYGLPKDEVVAELNQILKEIKLSDKEKEALQKRLSEFENPPADKDLGFNCREDQCNEGG